MNGMKWLAKISPMKMAAEKIGDVSGSYMKKTVIIVTLLFSVFHLNGQRPASLMPEEQVCRKLLSEADSLFSKGIYDLSIGMLEDILENCELSKEDKLKAMEILAKAYVETDDPEKADATIALMLKDFPHYELDEQDNPESYNRLVKKYRIHPRFSVGLRNTLDWMNYNTTSVFYYNGMKYDEPYVKDLEGIINDFNWMYYGWAELEFAGGISLNADLIFKWTNFERVIGTEEFDLTFKEQDNFIEIPMYLKKYFNAGKNLLPYAAAGFGWLYMTKATGSADKDYHEVGRPSVTTGDVSMLEARNRSTFEWIAGVGLGYKLKNLRLFVDVRYYRGLNSITNPENGLLNNSITNDYLYIDNYVRLSQFEMGASASYTFINSVRRKRK
jgi:hypothetical protein